jgi:copper homeostasis protein (lipoprotein)
MDKRLLHRPRIATGSRATGWIAAGLLASVLVGPAVARAGSISSSASYRERIALPPDAVFEAVLTDSAVADAAALELGWMRLEPANQQPFHFTILYRESASGPRGLYSVQAPLLSSGQVAGPQQPMGLHLAQVGGGRPGSQLGPLPASWRGDLPRDSGTTRWQVDLASDGTFQLRQTELSQAQQRQTELSSQDDIGRWRLEPGSNRLLLKGSREAPVFLQPLDNGAALRKLDLEGQPLASGGNDRLQRLAAPEPIEPRLQLAGMFRYLADAASIRLCATGAKLPVAMEGDYLPLERAYLEAQPAESRGEPMLVNLEGLITSRPSAEPGRDPVRTLVVERFVHLHPGQGCPRNAAAGPTAAATWPALRGQPWRLQALQDGERPNLLSAPEHQPELELAADSDQVSGSGGCNLLMGSAQIKGETIRFSQLASTQMACTPEVMAFENRYGQALERVRRWSIDKRTLLLQDERGRTLLVFQPTI